MTSAFFIVPCSSFLDPGKEQDTNLDYVRSVPRSPGLAEPAFLCSTWNRLCEWLFRVLGHSSKEVLKGCLFVRRETLEQTVFKFSGYSIELSAYCPAFFCKTQAVDPVVVPIRSSCDVPLVLKLFDCSCSRSFVNGQHFTQLVLAYAIVS